MTMKKIIAAAYLAALTGTSVAEQGSTKSNNVFDQHEWGLSLNSMLIDSKVARDNKVSEELLSINFYWQGRINHLLVAAGIGVLEYDDYGDYGVRVEDQYGNRSTQKAEASGMDLNIEMGYRQQFSNLNLDILAGYSSFNSNRSVDNCSDCPDEDINVGSGGYVKPRIGYQFGKKWALELSYIEYFSADVSGNVGLAFTYRN